MLPQNLDNQIIQEAAAGQPQVSQAEGHQVGQQEQPQNLSEIEQFLDKYKDHTYRMLLQEALAAKSYSKIKAHKLKTAFLGENMAQK